MGEFIQAMASPWVLSFIIFSKNELEVQFGILANIENPQLYTNGIDRIPADAFTDAKNSSVWIRKISRNVEKMYGKQLFLYSTPEDQKR